VDGSREENAILYRMQEKLKEFKHLRSYLEELEALRIKYDSHYELWVCICFVNFREDALSSTSLVASAASIISK
jgi:hypothetical protein